MDIVYAKCAKPVIYAELHEGLQPFVYWHVTESIQEGYDPEAVGELQEEVEVEALVLERRSTARNRALGHFISLLQYYLARQSEPVSLESAIDALRSDLDKQGSDVTFDDFHLNTVEIYECVEEQKQNAGLIADDPGWHRQPKTGEKSQWNNVFKKALELTRTAYVDACKRFEHRFKVGADADLALVQLLSPDKLVELVSMFKVHPKHISAPPASPDSSPMAKPSFWAQRIGNKSGNSNKIMPQFDSAHLVKAGQQFRTACIEHVRSQHASAPRSSEPGKDSDVILSQALNPESNPQRLIECAHHCSTPQNLPDLEVEKALRSGKDLLSSALRILGTRDGERNVSLRIEAYNLRGYVNLRLADLKPQHEANHLSHAINDWSASVDLDMDQNKIVDILDKTKKRLESLPKAIKGAVDREPSSMDSNLSKQSLGSQGSTISAASTSTAKAEKSERPPATSTAKEATNPAKKDAQPKPREKTILESPFLRSDLVTGLMVDSLLALPFPHRAFRETLRFPSAATVAAASQDHVPLLDRLAKSHQTTTKSLTEGNKAQLKVAVKCVSAVLALPDLQQTKGDSTGKVLQRTSLRLVLGTLHLLLGNFVKAQTELDLVSNALRPNPRAKGNGLAKNNKGKDKLAAMPEAQPVGQAARPIEAANGEEDEAIQAMRRRVQGEAPFLLAKTCWMTNKVQEAIKFFRWFGKWYSEQQALAVELAGEGELADIEVPELDMGWWDKVVVVTKE